MRWIVGIVLALIGLGCVLAAMPGPGPDSRSRGRDSWRRTVRGWELRTQWPTDDVAPPPSLHPAVVGAFQATLSLLALAAFGRVGSRPESTSPEVAAGNRQGGNTRPPTDRPASRP